MSIFTAEYWKSASRELKNSRVVTFAGIVIAFCVALESMPIYILGPSLKFYFSFLFMGLGGLVYGPVVSVLAGGIVDTIGFLLAGYGEPYFPGYLISAMLGGLVYGLFLYRQKLTVVRVLLMKAVVNFGLNVLLGSYWKAMLYGKGYLYYFTTGLWKNAVLLPVEAAMLYFALRFVERQGLVRKYIRKR